MAYGLLGLKGLITIPTYGRRIIKVYGLKGLKGLAAQCPRRIYMVYGL